MWRLLEKIPMGRVTTYGEIARAAGKPGAARAVGNACGANPSAPRVPCHRVVNSSGFAGGYSGGAEAKFRLLESEGVEVRNGKVDLGKHMFRFRAGGK